MDVWATATDDRMYEYPMLVNLKQEFKELFEKALENCENIKFYDHPEENTKK